MKLNYSFGNHGKRKSIFKYRGNTDNMQYLSFNEAMKARFGCKVYKLALDGGFTCPNRDGTIDTRGCIFCSKGGSGEFAAHGTDIQAQIAGAKKLVESKNKGGKYIAYFQSYSGTYAPLPKLKQIYTEAISGSDIVALDIATRPDCLGEPVIELLRELNKVKPVWVELGLQTVKEESAEYIRRGYPLETYDSAVKKLKSAGIEVITHMILGIPGETLEDMRATAKYISDSGSDGIKLHMLYVLKDTDLARDYSEGKFEVMTLEQYCEAVKACISELRPDIVVHRITGDGAKKDLIAPQWSGNKKHVLNELRKTLAE